MLQGVKLSISKNMTGLEEFFRACLTTDMLDAVAIILDLLRRNNEGVVAALWQQWVSTIFEEENLSYKIDQSGLVQPFIDAEFETNRASALESLNEPRFAEARRDFDDAYRHLRNKEGKQALRMMFPSVETAAKVLFPGAFANLGPSEIERNIAPRMSPLHR
jgi:hypothetical protein